MFDNMYGIDIIFTGACNMKCTYCYIHKHPDNMREYNAKIRTALTDGSYVQKIRESFEGRKEQLQRIGLWGAEPTINADCFAPFALPLLQEFPSLNHFLVSTNALLGLPAVKQFIDTLCDFAIENKRYIWFELQFSLDGPAYINDSSRHPGATDNTVKVLKEVVQYYLDHTKENPDVEEYFGLDINTKPTVDAHWQKYLVEHNDKLIEWFDFFDQLHTECVNMCGECVPEKLNFCIANLPTVVDPGEHSIEDGKIFAQFVKALRHLDVSRWNYYRHPLNWQFYRSYAHQLGQYKGYIVQPGAYCCSAGRETWSLDYKGDVQVCHRAFDNAYMGLSQAARDIIPDISTEGYYGEKRIDQLVALDYTNLLFHGLDGTACRLRFISYELQALVITGQYSPEILDEDRMKLLLQYIGGISCHQGQLEETGSIYVTTLSYINLLANGAVDELQYYFTIADQLNEEQLGNRQEGDSNESC